MWQEACERHRENVDDFWRTEVLPQCGGQSIQRYFSGVRRLGPDIQGSPASLSYFFCGGSEIRKSEMWLSSTLSYFLQVVIMPNAQRISKLTSAQFFVIDTVRAEQGLRRLPREKKARRNIPKAHIDKPQCQENTNYGRARRGRHGAPRLLWTCLSRRKGKPCRWCEGLDLSFWTTSGKEDAM